MSGPGLPDGTIPLRQHKAETDYSFLPAFPFLSSPEITDWFLIPYISSLWNPPFLVPCTFIWLTFTSDFLGTKALGWLGLPSDHSAPNRCPCLQLGSQGAWCWISGVHYCYYLSIATIITNSMTTNCQSQSQVKQGSLRYFLITVLGSWLKNRILRAGIWNEDFWDLVPTLHEPGPVP